MIWLSTALAIRISPFLFSGSTHYFAVDFPLLVFFVLNRLFFEMTAELGAHWCKVNGCKN